MSFEQFYNIIYYFFLFKVNGGHLELTGEKQMSYKWDKCQYITGHYMKYI